MKKHEEKGGREGGFGGGREGGRDGGGKEGGERRSFQRRKGCRFCNEPQIEIDYKDRYILQPFLSERFKIAPRRISGNCAAHQRELTTAIKRARHAAIIPYTSVQN